MGMIYDVWYYYANGRTQAGSDPNASDIYVRSMIGRKSADSSYVVAKNTNGDGHTICINPDGKVVSFDDLPWIVAERKQREKAERKQFARRCENALRDHKTIIRDITKEAALISVDGKPEKWVTFGEIEDWAGADDEGNDLVPFYSGLLARIHNHPKYKTLTEAQ